MFFNGIKQEQKWAGTENSLVDRSKVKLANFDNFVDIPTIL